MVASGILDHDGRLLSEGFMADKRYDVGVLFVHGMGEQQRGDTLTDMGEAVSNWLRRRFAPESEPTIRRATLRSDAAGAAEVAEVVISFDDTKIVDEGTSSATASKPVRWLLRESRWADTFRPAGFVETMLWAISVGPWLMAYQFDGVRARIQRGQKVSLAVRLLRTAVGIVLAIAAAAGAAAITPLAIVLTILSLLPIPFVQGLARAAQRNLAGSYGDLSILVRSPFRFAAMWSRVARDVDALERQCAMVAVVAHSQGSAVSWQAIRRLKQRHADDGGPRTIGLFVSFGQAIRKLKMLYLIHTEANLGEKLFIFASALTSTIVLLAAAVNVFLIVVDGPQVVGLQIGETAISRWALLLVYLVMVFVIQAVLAGLVRKWAEKTELGLIDEIKEVRGGGFEWVDLWASADPAPNGELLREPGAVGDCVSSYKIRNLGSTVLDHTVYWKNDTEFLTAVVHAIAAKSKRRPELLKDKTPEALRSAVHHRHYWVDLLVASRYSYFTTAGIFAFFVRDVFTDVGTRASEWARVIPGVAGDFSLGSWVAGLLGFALFALGAVLAWSLAVSRIWNALHGWEAGDVLVGNAPRMPSRGAAAWTLGHAGAVLGFAIWLLLNHGTAAILSYAVVMLVGIVVVVSTLGGGGTLVAPKPEGETSSEKPEAQGPVADSEAKKGAATSLAI